MQLIVNLSFKKLKGNIVDNYHLSLRGWSNKDITWNNIYKVMNKDNIQFSCYEWNNGVKIPKTFRRDKQNCIILDIDDGISIHKIQSMFKKYTYIIGTTKSHMKDKKGIVCERFRMIIPCINIPTDDDVYFRTLELIAPFNDEQTLTKTASFLGNSKAIIIRNDGDTLDLYKASMLAKQQLDEEFKETVVVDRDFINSNGSSIDDVKSQLTVEIVKEVLESIGIEFVGNKCRLREDDRTASCKIFPSCWMKDFGGDFSGDIFALLMERESISFTEAINYTKNFI